ncbi:hypothetical protein BSLG_005917 [Batrachochytrium salamandrivorans]|nr:hypothetical protein BSLG_005917 [Batrachochytrium salamandrivorans]
MCAVLIHFDMSRISHTKYFLCAVSRESVVHYFLLRLPILQQNLLSHKIMLDPIKYRELSKALVKTSFGQAKKEHGCSTWSMSFRVLVMTFLFFTISDKDMEILNMPTPISLYIGIMLVEIVLSADNFQIMIQFYFITGTTLAKRVGRFDQAIIFQSFHAKICLNLQTALCLSGSVYQYCDATSIYSKQADPAVYNVSILYVSFSASFLESLLFIEAVKNFKIQVKDTLNIEMVEMFSNQIQDNLSNLTPVNEVNLPKRL